MQSKQPISIVIPTLNEVDNIPTIFARIEAALTPASIPYEIIIVDDHSTDGTAEIVQQLSSTYPVSFYSKIGQRGKAYSLLEGFSQVAYDLIVMIDADLQYAPEEIVAMYTLMETTAADVVVTNRVEKNAGWLRTLSTKVFNLLFARLLFGIHFDTQSGLKLFKKQLLTSFKMYPSPWSFDLEFLVRALENKYTIVSHDIQFSERSYGTTKVKLLSTTFELAKASLQLWLRTSTSKIRAGYKANNQFLKKSLQAVVITSVFALSVAGSSQPVQALEVDLENPSVPDVSQLLTGGDSPTTPQAAIPQTDTSATSSSKQPTSSASKSVTPARTTPTRNTAPRTAARSATTSAQPVIVADEPDRSDLRAATNAEPLDIYGHTYPNYTLSLKTSNRLFNTSQIIILAGIGCVIVVLASQLQAVRKFATALIPR